MIIETKFNPAQEVWTTANHKAQKFVIEGITFICECDKIIRTENDEVIDRHFTHEVAYLLNGDWVSEDCVFATKEELINSL